MKKNTEQQHEAMYRAVEELFRDAASRYPHASARTDARGPAGNNLLELSCSMAGSAAIKALPGADQIDLYPGHTWLELLPAGRGPERMLARVREVVEAVVTGRFEEELTERDGRIVRSKAFIFQPDRKRIDRYLGSLPTMLAPGRKRTVRYAPYG